VIIGMPRMTYELRDSVEQHTKKNYVKILHLIMIYIVDNNVGLLRIANNAIVYIY